MLFKRPMHIDTINDSDKAQRLYDHQLAGGFLDYAAHQVQPIPTAVWMRRMRTSWLFRAPEVQPDVGIAPATEDLSGLSMAQLRERAKGVGLTIPVGMTKKSAAEMILKAEGDTR